jgi:hypothetical protein
MNQFTYLVAACALGASASASDLDLRIESGGQTAVTVSPGQIVTYDVIGELTDSLNEGLALFSIDLGMPGVTLTPAGTPLSTNMLNFDRPLGLTNPAGFGGTQSGSSLKQVGGMQNTLKNGFAPVPNGTVITGIAKPGSPESLASGQVVMPTVSGTYTLGASNVLANIIRQGETGAPTWMVDAAGLGSSTPLTVTVEALSVNTTSVSLAAGGSINFTLDGGVGSAGQLYMLLGSASGTTPGIGVDGLTLDLVFDSYLVYTLTHPNTAPYAGTLGALDGSGMGSASLTVPPASDPALAGASLNHAFFVLNGGLVTLTSNPATLNLLP